MTNVSILFTFVDFRVLLKPQISILQNVRGSAWYLLGNILSLLLDSLAALHFADDFDVRPKLSQSSTHILHVLGGADEAGEHHVHAVSHPEPQVGLVLLAHRLQADQVASREVHTFTTAEQSTRLHHRVHPIRACRHPPRGGRI